MCYTAIESQYHLLVGAHKMIVFADNYRAIVLIADETQRALKFANLCTSYLNI
jgi:nitrous oxide reductase accessory protein NosL